MGYDSHICSICSIALKQVVSSFSAPFIFLQGSFDETFPHTLCFSKENQLSYTVQLQPCCLSERLWHQLYRKRKWTWDVCKVKFSQINHSVRQWEQSTPGLKGRQGLSARRRICCTTVCVLGLLFIFTKAVRMEAVGVGYVVVHFHFQDANKYIYCSGGAISPKRG